MKSALRKLLPLTAATAAVVVLAGCTGNATQNVDLANGRDLFISKCGTCHTLAQAATTAQVGPDLDAAFAAARHAGMDDDTIKGVVHAQIENPRAVDTSSPTYMPPGLVKGQDAEDVASYVASVAGVPGIKPPTAPGGPGGQVFANNGCGSCHALAAAGSSGQVGPNLDEVLPGQSTAMITQSIVDPSAKIAKGYQDGVMPQNFGDTIDPKDLKLLVQFLSDCAGKKMGCGETKGGSSGSSGGGS